MSKKELKNIDSVCFVCVQELKGRKDTVWISTCDHYFCGQCCWNAFAVQMIEMKESANSKEKKKEGADGSDEENDEKGIKNWLYCPKCLVGTDGAFV